MKRKTSSNPDGKIKVLAPENLPYQLYLLVQRMTRHFQTVLVPYDLTPLHWGILCCLWRQDRLRTSEITSQLEQLGGTITVGLDAMQRRGLIERVSDDNDRRILRIALTAKGRSLQSRLEPAAQILIQSIFSCMTPEEYRRFAGQVDALRSHMASNNGQARLIEQASQSHKDEVKTP